MKFLKISKKYLKNSTEYKLFIFNYKNINIIIYEKADFCISSHTLGQGMVQR